MYNTLGNIVVRNYHILNNKDASCVNFVFKQFM